jgi:hypothetical protein
MEKISWTVVWKIKYYINSRTGISYIQQERGANWNGQILRRNCRLKHVIEAKIEGMIEMTRRREKRRKQLL